MSKRGECWKAAFWGERGLPQSPTSPPSPPDPTAVAATRLPLPPPPQPSCLCPPHPDTGSSPPKRPIRTAACDGAHHIRAVVSWRSPAGACGRRGLRITGKEEGGRGVVQDVGPSCFGTGLPTRLLFSVQLIGVLPLNYRSTSPSDMKEKLPHPSANRTASQPGKDISFG